MAEEPGFVPLIFHELPTDEMAARADAFHASMDQRRTTRHFSTRDVPRELIEKAVLTGGTAPSGAHLEPWTFVAISNPELKQRMREEAEVEEPAPDRAGRSDGFDYRRLTGPEVAQHEGFGVEIEIRFHLRRKISLETGPWRL